MYGRVPQLESEKAKQKAYTGGRSFHTAFS